MEKDAILSFNTAAPGRSAVAAPSPVLDLVYACFYLRGLRTAGSEPLEWARRLRRDEPELADAAAELVDPREKGNPLFVMAVELDYGSDETPQRFLEDLPNLPELLVAAFPNAADCADDPDAPSFLRNPPGAAWAAKAAKVLSELWQELGPVWEASGRRAAEAAARGVIEGLEEHGDVLRALPRRHFAQFESLSGSLRDAQARGRLRVVPLAFAEGGGFHLQGERITAVGFGLHGERIHEVMEKRVSDAAVGAKALADPTRLMLLSLVTRFDRMPMTVGDLAVQLSVSQPTVSGHLKLLRQAGLVEIERKGNKTFPKANESAIKEALEALSAVLRV